MRFIKLINEGWSDDYITDFSDNGFSITETPSKVTGKYKGKFILSDLNSWFTEMIDKLSMEHDVLSNKVSFNKVTGYAMFEVEIAKNHLVGIIIDLDGKDVEFKPNKIIYVHRKSVEIDGVYENRKKTLRIWLSDDKIQKVSLGNRSIGVSINKKNMSKIFNLFDSGQIKFYSHDDWSIDRNTEYFLEFKRRYETFKDI